MEIKDGEFQIYLGDYHYYLDKLEEDRETKRLAKIAAEKAEKKAEKLPRKNRRKKKKLLLNANNFLVCE